MTDENKLEEFFPPQKKEKRPRQDYKPKKKGKVELVVKDKYIVLNVDGNGERIAYDEKLKVGDEIEI